MSGNLAECAIWNRALADDEIAALYFERLSPLWFPNGLVAYAPLIQDTIDAAGKRRFTPTGTKVSQHPPGIVYPPRFDPRFLFGGLMAPPPFVPYEPWRQRAPLLAQ